MEIYELIKKLKTAMLYGQGISLSKKELHELLKYITTLEKK